jgi:hypothetical protein
VGGHEGPWAEAPKQESGDRKEHLRWVVPLGFVLIRSVRTYGPEAQHSPPWNSVVPQPQVGTTGRISARRTALRPTDERSTTTGRPWDGRMARLRPQETSSHILPRRGPVRTDTSLSAHQHYGTCRPDARSCCFARQDQRQSGPATCVPESGRGREANVRKSTSIHEVLEDVMCSCCSWTCMCHRYARWLQSRRFPPAFELLGFDRPTCVPPPASHLPISCTPSSPSWGTGSPG